jgi:hypothetical protein
MTLEEYREKVLASIDYQIGYFERRELSAASDVSDVRRSSYARAQRVLKATRAKLAAIPLHDPPATDNRDEP